MGIEAAAGDAPTRPRRRRLPRRDLTTPGLLGLPLAWLVVFFVAPIAIVAAYSFDVYSLFPGPHGFTFAGWRGFFHDAVYLRLFWKSVQMSLIVSAIIVVLAYPLAYFLALSGTKRKYILLLVLIAPFLTSYLLRVLAWKVILGDQGVVNTFLFWTGLRSPGHPISALLYSRFAVIPTVGEFITPSLVGGTSGYMYGNQIVDLFGTGFPDWTTGSVLALFLLVVVGALTLV